MVLAMIVGEVCSKKIIVLYYCWGKTVFMLSISDTKEKKEYMQTEEEKRSQGIFRRN